MVVVVMDLGFRDRIRDMRAYHTSKDHLRDDDAIGITNQGPTAFTFVPDCTVLDTKVHDVVD